MAMSEAMRRRLLGTSASDVAPWQSWDSAMDPMAGASDDLKAEVSEYAKKRHGITSNQNIEELCRQKEMSKEMVKDYKFYMQDELLEEKFRRGRVMNCFEFLEKLNTIIPAYLSVHVNKGMSGLAVMKPKEITNEAGDKVVTYWQYVCGVQVYWMWEYSVLHIDKRGLPLNEKYRGWRTVLLRLIQGEYITEAQADKVFGEATGVASRRYREQLFCWRNRKEAQ